MALALQAYPFDSVDTTETQFGTLFGLLQDDGVDDVPTSTSGQVTAGTGFSLNVAAFAGAYVSGVYAALAAPGSVSLAAAAASTRIDRVVLRVNSGSNTAVVDVLTGTPGAGNPPALTQTPGGIYELSLAKITVPAGALNIVTSNIVDERPFLSTFVHQYTSTTRPAGVKGWFGFNHTTATPEFCTAPGTWLSFLDWANLSGKPSTFPPAAHNHDGLYPRLDTPGSVTQAMLPLKIFRAIVAITPSGAYPQRTTAAVSFGGLFTAIPAVSVTPTTTTPDNVSVSHANPSASGTTLVLSRDDGNVPTSLSVIAVGV